MKKLFTTLLGVVACAVVSNAQQFGTPTYIGNKADYAFSNQDKAPGDTIDIYPPASDTCTSTDLVIVDAFGTYSMGPVSVSGVAQKFIHAGTADVVVVGCYLQLIGTGDASPYSITLNAPGTVPGAVLGTGTLALDTLLDPANNIFFAFWTFPEVEIENEFYVAGTVTPTIPTDTIRYLLNDCSSANSFLNIAGAWGNAEAGGIENDISFEIIAIEGVNTASIAESAISAAGLMPNPANDFSVLMYSLKENATVTIKISNVAGQTVKQISEGSKQAGTYAAVIDVKDLAVGTYIYQITANGYSSTGRLVVSK